MPENKNELSGLNELARDIHENAKALCNSELSEALEEYRNSNPPVYFKEANGFEVSELQEWRGEKPEGIAVEMADCIIRILDWCGREGIDIDAIIRMKHEYNTTRPYKHGGKVC